MDDRPRYMISVAADLVGMHPQTLRIYEQKGLVRPKRTNGNTRLYSDAALGAKAEVPTPDGPVNVKVKPGTTDGTLLRVKGKGAPKLKASGRGDLIARLQVTVPTKLTKAEREALENLQKVSRENPREALYS